MILMIVQNRLNTLHIGASQQCDAGKRRCLVHGEEEVLPEGTFGAAAAIYSLEEVPRKVQAVWKEGDDDWTGLIMMVYDCFFFRSGHFPGSV